MTAKRLERLKVSNFQSLNTADIELGGFTVIVGPSNSGKSALLRALKAVVRNVNSPSAVRAGKGAFTSSVLFGKTAISIERGKSQSTYRINLPSGDEEVYAKAGRTVPSDVQMVLGLPEYEGPDLVFSSQIDPPWLLNETGSVAAKILGDLTNVSKLHAASREANRRRLEASKMQKIRQEDAEGCSVRLQEEFGDLREHVAEVRQARSMLDEVLEKSRLRDSLSEVLEALHTADAAEKDLMTRLAELTPPGDIETLAERAGELLGSRHSLLDSLDSLMRCDSELANLEHQLVEAGESVSTLQQQYQETLKAAGDCPTCGQKIAS